MATKTKTTTKVNSEKTEVAPFTWCDLYDFTANEIVQNGNRKLRVFQNMPAYVGIGTVSANTNIFSVNMPKKRNKVFAVYCDTPQFNAAKIQYEHDSDFKFAENANSEKNRKNCIFINENAVEKLKCAIKFAIASL